MTLKTLLYLFVFLFFIQPFFADQQKKGNKILGTIIKQQLEHYHFSRKERKIDDEFSKDAFELFLKGLDSQKRIFIQKNIDELKQYQTKIDDELHDRRPNVDYSLPMLAAEMVKSNLKKIQAFSHEILKHKFDYRKNESIETDPEKIDFCKDFNELKERWRKHLKYQSLNSYLNLIEKEKLSKEVDMSLSLDSIDAQGLPVTTSPGLDKTNSNEIVLDEKKHFELREKAREKTQKNIDRYFKRLLEMKEQDHYSRYFNAITASFDPHTNYMDPDSKKDFDIHMKKSLEGIGAVLQELEGLTKVVRIVPGSASHRQGELEAEDLILRVAQGEDGHEIDITGMRIREVVKYIRGPKGTTVKLTVKKPDNQIKVISIVRDIVKLEGDAVARSAHLKKDEKQSFGYIYLPDFYRDFTGKSGKNCTEDVRKELGKLIEEEIDGLVFDLRGNGGGALEDAKTIAGLFLKRGPIVQVKSSRGMVKVLHDQDGDRILYDGPLIIMVNQFSASASEILAAALQDYGRAVIVGTGPTHGKGTVQQLIPLDSFTIRGWGDYDFGSLKLTIQKFYRVNGGSTQKKGVFPDIVLPYERAYIESGERYLDHVMSWDKIPEVPYRKWDKKIDLERVSQESKKRVRENKIFMAIEKRYEQLKAKYDDTYVPLNLEIVKKERAENKKQGEEFNKIFENKEDEEKEENKDLSDKEKSYQKWLIKINKDPYIEESIHILKDLITKK